MKNYILIILTAITIVYLLPFRVAGNDFSDITLFSQISRQHGLPNNRVECMIQDKNGYIWFGTKRGLSKYDGYDFTTYRSNINDTTSLPYHHITELYETSDNTIWIGVWREGACKYNQSYNNFSKVNLDTKFPRSLEINQFFEDSKRRLWVLHQHGITVLNLKGDVLKDIKMSSLKTEVQVSAITETKNKELIIAVGSKILLFHDDLETFTEMEYSSDAQIGNIHEFYQYDEQTIWLATEFGISAYDLKQKTITSIYKSKEGAFKFFIEDEQKNIWFGSSFPMCYDRKNSHIHSFDEESKKYIPKIGNFFTCGMMDNQKNLWFGNNNNGITKCYIENTSFNHYPKLQSYLDDNSIDVTAIFQDDEEKFFLGTALQGLMCFDENETEINMGQQIPCMSNLNNELKLVRDIKSDPSGNIWIGASEPGAIIIYNPEDDKCQSYYKPVSSFLFDSKGNNWIGEATGATSFDFENEQFSYYNYGNISISGIADWMEDNDGNIWIASVDYGIFLIDTYEKRLIPIAEKYNNLPNEKGISLLIDSKGRIWIGFEFYGLFYKEPDQEQFIQLTQQDGLSSNDICSIEEDNDGNIWIGTNHGLSCYIYSTGRFRNYYKNDGLSGDEFNYNASFKNKNGILLFGSTNGLVAFNPEKIKDYDTPLPTVIREVIVNNGNVDSDIYGIPIGKACIGPTVLNLRHNQNTISIKYSTINLSSSKKSQFAYMLKGIDEDFHYVGEQRQINYSHLPPGEYMFSVKATNNDNVWNENETSFSFIIRRHPLKSILALVLYFLVFCLMALVGFRIGQRQNKLKREVLSERIAKQQNDELMKMKLRFFTNISHEFKTPLSLIISPLEEIISNLHGNSLLKKKLKQIRGNSQRLLILINQLIEFRKIEQDVLPVKKEDLNLVDVTRNEMSLFYDVAELKNIQFELKTDIQDCQVNTDRDKIEKILGNLLSNAFKNTPENGKITVKLKLSDRNIEVSIRDNGYGISEESLEFIFDRFYQEKHTDHISGIGLTYVKKIIELLGGTIEVKSQIDKGTEVVFTIPDATQRPVVEVFNRSILAEQSQSKGKNIATIKSSNDESKLDAPKILVVEDDFEMRMHISSILSELYNVDQAADGLTAYEMIQKEEYSLVLSDIMMPKMDGIELCSKIKSKTKTSHIIVIVLSAKDEFGSEMAGYKTGANVYLTKPFQPQKLLSIVTNQLNTQQKAVNQQIGSPNDESLKLIGVCQKEKEFIAQVSGFIEKNIHNHDFCVKNIGDEFGLSRSKLYKKFKSIVKLSPKDFIKEIRMKKAAQLLKGNNLTASEIAYDLGYSSATNFFTAFRAYYGKTPREFQKESDDKNFDYVEKIVP